MKNLILTIGLIIGVFTLGYGQGWTTIGTTTSTTNDVEIGVDGCNPVISLFNTTGGFSSTVVNNNAFEINSRWAASGGCNLSNILTIMGTNNNNPGNAPGFLYTATTSRSGVEWDLNTSPAEGEFRVFIGDDPNGDPDFILRQNNSTPATHFVGFGTNTARFIGSNTDDLGFHYNADVNGSVLWDLSDHTGLQWRLATNGFDGDNEDYMFSIGDGYVAIGAEDGGPANGLHYSLERDVEFDFEGLESAQFSMFSDNYFGGNNPIFQVNHNPNGTTPLRLVCIGCSGLLDPALADRFTLRVSGEVETNSFQMFDGTTLVAGGQNVTGFVLTSVDNAGNAVWTDPATLPPNNNDNDWVDDGGLELVLGAGYTSVEPNASGTFEGCGPFTGNNLGADQNRWANVFCGTLDAADINVASDKRYKNNIEPITSALDKIADMQGYYYEYNREAFPTKLFPKGRQVGFIAQELESVVPEVVKTNSKGYKGVAYQNLVALLAVGINEQQTIIETQQTEIADLNTRLSALETLLTGQGNTNTIAPTAPVVTEISTADFALFQNVPNPAEGSTAISFALNGKFANATLVVQDVNGNTVREYDIKGQGEAKIDVDMSSVAKGIYAYSLVVDGKTVDTKTMVIQ